MTVSSCAGWLAVCAGWAGWLDWQPVVKTKVANAAPNKHKQNFLKDIEFPFVPRLEGTAVVGCKVYSARCQFANEASAARSRVRSCFGMFSGTNAADFFHALGKELFAAFLGGVVVGAALE